MKEQVLGYVLVNKDTQRVYALVRNQIYILDINIRY